MARSHRTEKNGKMWSIGEFLNNEKTVVSVVCITAKMPIETVVQWHTKYFFTTSKITAETWKSMKVAMICKKYIAISTKIPDPKMSHSDH